MKTPNRLNDLLDLLTRQIGAFPSVDKVILYGSRARGTADPFSDIDLAVLGVTDRQEWVQLWHLMQSAPTLLKIDLVQFEEASEALQASILQEGQVLYERPA